LEKHPSITYIHYLDKELMVVYIVLSQYNNYSDMSETRAGKYGRHLGELIGFVVDSRPTSERDEYRDKFLAELENYSSMPRIEGTPINEGCVHELDGVLEIDFNNPVHLALLVKESLHLMYQKRTSTRALESFKNSFTK